MKTQKNAAGRIWTAKDDAVTLPAWLGIPGIRHSIGLARWWHFSTTLFWMVNGIAFYILLFTTGQWLRLVPGDLGGDAQRGFDGASISIAHVTLVFITGARINLNMMFAGVNDNSWRGVGLFVPAMLLVAVLHE